VLWHGSINLIYHNSNSGVFCVADTKLPPSPCIPMEPVQFSDTEPGTGSYVQMEPVICPDVSMQVASNDCSMTVTGEAYPADLEDYDVPSEVLDDDTSQQPGFYVNTSTTVQPSAYVTEDATD
jgi:hypothetical protein